MENMNVTEHADKAMISSSYGFNDRFRLGFMYGAPSNRLSAQINYLLLKEDKLKPNLILGTGSFRGVISESHPYLIAVKKIMLKSNLPIKVSMGVKQKADNIADLNLEPMGNIVIRVYKDIHFMVINESEMTDFAIYSKIVHNVTIGLRWLEFKSFALGIVVRK
jgi:hypothetical protein